MSKPMPHSHSHASPTHVVLVLRLFALCLAVALSGTSALEANAESKAQVFDVVVLGATPGGIAAGLAAATSETRVLLLEESAHVGGIVSGGLTVMDIRRPEAVGGFFRAFTEHVKHHYISTYGANSSQVADCQNGLHMEPRVAEQSFRALIAANPNLTVRLGMRLKSVVLAGSKLAAIEMESAQTTGERAPERFQAKVFIDATYEGDLAAAVGVPYRVGRESRAEYGEPQAGVIYRRTHIDEYLPGSTGEADNGIQAYCFRFVMTTNEANRVPIQKPAAYLREDYRHLLADMQSGKLTKLGQAIQLAPLPNDRFLINSNHPDPETGVPSESLDLAEENWGWPEGTPEQRRKIFERTWSYNEGLIWFLQNDPEISKEIQTEARRYGFCKDEFTDNNHRPHAIYVRQGRRIMGEYVFTQREADLDPTTQRPRLHPDSIALVEYPFDSHGVHKYDPAHPGVREGYFYVDHPPLQVPYGVIVPRKIDGLLVPVACSCSHVGYSALRMEPVFMALGEAAGYAARLAIAQNKVPRELSGEAVRAEVERHGGTVELP